MRKFILFIGFISCALFVDAQSLVDDLCALGDQLCCVVNIDDARAAYKKALKSKDLNVQILASYRVLELNFLKKGSVGAYESGYFNALIKKNFKKMGSPLLERDEFYKKYQVPSLAEVMAGARNASINANNQPALASAEVPSKEESAKQVPLSDVDRNIPETQKETSDKTFVIIIANENYQEVEDVLYAINDGTTFSEYCKKTLGIPEKNISLVKDATANNMKREIRWLTQILEQYEGEAKAIVYYAGHGIPDEKTKDAYLLPVDGYGDDPTTGYSLNELYATLNEVPSKSVLVFLDACFSGSKREGGMLASARGVAIKVKPTVPVGNMVVFSAAQGDETAYPYKEKGHGLFTYYLLKKLQETKGDVTLSELKEYITDQVGKQSIITNRKPQTPNVSVSSTILTDWSKMKMKQ